MNAMQCKYKILICNNEGKFTKEGRFALEKKPPGVGHCLSLSAAGPRASHAITASVDRAVLSPSVY